MSERAPFALLDLARRDPDNRGPRELADRLATRTLPRSLTDLAQAARHFVPSPELAAAVNVALTLGAPLLLTGEPGTGKTQVAFFVAHYFGLELEQGFYLLPVGSATGKRDLLYRFDMVAYYHAAHDPKRPGPLDRRQFLEPGPLWQAYERQGPSVVLVDEIDKAPRDFPNDLLFVLDQHRFPVPELNLVKTPIQGAPPPIIIITSNSERRLPEPFLRRCIFHHLELTEELLRAAVRSRAGDFPRLPEATRDAAVARFLELRGRPLRKKPATAELLAWLTVLSAAGIRDPRQLQTPPLRQLPFLGVLVKDREDYGLL